MSRNPTLRPAAPEAPKKEISCAPPLWLELICVLVFIGLLVYAAPDLREWAATIGGCR